MEAFVMSERFKTKFSRLRIIP